MTGRPRIGWRLGRLFATAALMSAGPALAQPTQPPATATGEGASQVSEVVVTAQKREERLRDIPIAVSAITAADIASRDVTSLDQLQSAVPGLRLVDIGPGSQRIELRGISQYQGLPTVGNYLDEFSINPITASGFPEVRLLDMQRIEVLRGPQPTLYGEGSMGGTIRYVTADPELTRFGGSVLGEVAGVEDGEVGYRLEGVVNAPIVTDKAGLRFAFAREGSPGWIDGPLGKDGNGADLTTFRGKFLAHLTDRLTVTLLGMYQENTQDIKSYSNADQVTAQIVPSIANLDYVVGTALVAYDFGPVSLLSSSGYLRQSNRSVDDSAKFYNGLFGAPLLRTAITDSDGVLEKWSQEFRLTSNGAGPLRYLIAASFTETRSGGQTLGDGESLVPGLPASALGVVFNQTSSQASRIWAVYGNVSYDLGPFTLDAGGRYFHDRRSIDSTFSVTGFPPPSVEKDTATFDSFNPRVALNYKTGTSGILYVSAAKGFRSGGFNQVTAPQVPPTFGPETLWTYEGGFKQSLFGRKVYVEASAYYNDYTNIQANQLVNPTVATVLNAGKATGPGVELTVQVHPLADLQLTGNMGYTHLRYDQTTTDRNKGDPPDLVPDWNASVAVDYSPALTPSARLIAHADLNYTGQGFIILRSPPLFNEAVPNEERVLVNTRLGASFAGGYEAYVFVTNLFDEDKIINPAFGAFFEPTYTRPRTIGFGVKAKF